MRTSILPAEARQEAATIIRQLLFKCLLTMQDVHGVLIRTGHGEITAMAVAAEEFIIWELILSAPMIMYAQRLMEGLQLPVGKAPMEIM